MHEVRAELKQLEKYDHMQIAQKLEENKRLQRNLAQCQEELQATPPPPTPTPGKMSYTLHLPQVRLHRPHPLHLTSGKTLF